MDSNYKPDQPMNYITEIKFRWDQILRYLRSRGLIFADFMDFLKILKIYFHEIFVIFHSVKIKPFEKFSKTWNSEIVSFKPMGHPLSKFAKFSEKLTFLTPWYSHVCVRIRGLEMLVFRNILRMYLMDDPQPYHRSLKTSIEVHFYCFFMTYMTSIWEKKTFGRSTAYSCRTNVFMEIYGFS